ncbi:HI0074 family nucleotidyltransferase substrate-binding subunit [Rossellomorea oryzaecorticis]|uniref:HI0074 family nucleotidyltransferase substrate-binding subunit n=1 Tax=Rossellomorea oryzaecorticis TaxID=1396505 RepID=A0ABW8VVS5_9BACI
MKKEAREPSPCFPELSWKLLKSYLEYNGVTDISSPRSTIKTAFKEGLIKDGELWLKMLEDRNRTSLTYDEATALDIYNNIKHAYITLLDRAYETLSKKYHPGIKKQWDRNCG